MRVENLSSWTRPNSCEQELAIRKVQKMLKSLETEGENVITEKSLEYDGFQPEVIELQPFEEYRLAPELEKHLVIAASRIRIFAERQKATLKNLQFEDAFGSYGHTLVPLQTAACYIPGGRFPLVSSALMTLIPAQIAGVQTRIAVSPSVHPALLAAASLAGATSFLKLGGAQAILAMAYGFKGIPPVDIICGPGNAYVNAAKELVQGKVKIDSLAGPSELLILAHPSTPVEFLVEDMLAQAEHDPMALSVCISTSKTFLESLGNRLQALQVDSLGDCHLLFAEDVGAMIDFSNTMGPEHVLVTYPESQLDPASLVNYGSLFLGEWSAVALGDYCSGPNHTLPTRGFARQKGGLFVGDFLKTMTWQKISSSRAFTELAETAAALAEAEGLIHHKRSLEVRMSNLMS